METNKLLTLEEIEELRIVNSLTDADARADLDSLMARLLATARAYWEMKNQYDIITSEFDSSGRFINKPHPATLKVIVEAMKAMQTVYDTNSSLHNVAIEAGIETLEKHLE